MNKTRTPEPEPEMIPSSAEDKAIVVKSLRRLAAKLKKLRKGRDEIAAAEVVVCALAVAIEATELPEFDNLDLLNNFAKIGYDLVTTANAYAAQLEKESAYDSILNGFTELLLSGEIEKEIQKAIAAG